MVIKILKKAQIVWLTDDKTGFLIYFFLFLVSQMSSKIKIVIQ